MENQANNTPTAQALFNVVTNGNYYDYLGNLHLGTGSAGSLVGCFYKYTVSEPTVGTFRGVIFNRSNYLRDKNSQERRDIVQAIYKENPSDYSQTGYVFKKDAKPLFRARELGKGANYAHNSLETIDIVMKGKTYHFLNWEDVYTAGIIQLAEDGHAHTDFANTSPGDYVDLRKVIDRENQRYISQRYISVSTMNGNSFFNGVKLYAMYDRDNIDGLNKNEYRSAYVNMHTRNRPLSIYARLTDENSYLCSWANDGTRIIKNRAQRAYIYNERQDRTITLYFTERKMTELLRETGEQAYNYKIGEEFERASILAKVYQGKNFMNLESAQHYYQNFDLEVCPHCGIIHDRGEHDQERCRRRNLRPQRYDYHSQRPAHDINLIREKTHLIGVEIEKEDEEAVYHSHTDIFSQFGWVKERDGSLDSSTGYELVSPMFPLFGTELIDTAKILEEKYPRLINGNFSRACGGHIHYSKKGLTGREQLEEICGYLPLIYSIYKFRTERNYCQILEKERMKNSTEKYQAVRILDERIEFRIFPAVKNIETLNFRIKLLQFMASNPTSNPVEVVNYLMDEASALHQLFSEIFDKKTIYKRALDSFKFANKYDANFFNIDFSANAKAIEEKASKL